MGIEAVQQAAALAGAHGREHDHRRRHRRRRPRRSSRRRTCAAASGAGCTTARPRSTSTAGAWWGLSISGVLHRGHRRLADRSTGSTSASTSRAASPGRCRRRTSPRTRRDRSLDGQRDRRPTTPKVQTLTGVERHASADPGRRPGPGRRSPAGAAGVSPTAAGVDVSEVASTRSARRGAAASPRRRSAPSSSSSSSSRCSSAGGSSGGWRSRRSSRWSTTSLISVGVYSLFGFEVTPATVVAFLTILGFSLYDTIVVFDKVQENTARYAGATRAVRRHRSTCR